MAGRFDALTDAGQSALFSVRDIKKSFGGTIALGGVSFDVHSGEIAALLGENGAGKSTLIKIMAGVFRADAGEMRFKGELLNTAAAHGRIAFIHQDLGLIPWMTVSENIMLGTSYKRRFGLIDWKGAAADAANALAIVGGDIHADDRVGDLTRTERSLVAISRALASKAELVVLDEPTASLPQPEVDRLHEVLRRLRSRGVGIIYVSHRLDEVYALTDRVVVLRDGRVAANRNTKGFDSKDLVQAIIGRPHDQVFVRPDAPVSPGTVLDVRSMTAGEVGPVSFTVGKGEIVGLVGLRGAGQDAIGRVLFGVAHRDDGEVTLDGQDYSARDPLEAIRSGVLMVAGDRNAESVAHGMSVRENMFLNPSASGRGLMEFRAPGTEVEEARRLGANVRLRPNEPSAHIETLSGGNQQKVVMARWMRIGGRLLILEDPTAGVDVGAKAEIYRLIGEATDRGLGVLLISTDFEEVTAICHRVHVFVSGRIIAGMQSSQLSVEALVNAASLSAAA
ncbi:sugar ABC transporter ATP-binding protein [Mesorhizobium sp. M0306]|uniref:sugar ABC transporter ATP-binding protein n=1 Tax=unclassified Mesorhizobium TaxID=325217 RepID=UPI00333D665B